MTSLPRTIARLEKRLERLRLLDRRFSVVRLAVFILGVAAAWLASATLSVALARLVWLGAAGSFALVVAFHRRLDRWRSMFSLWQEIRKEQQARLALDWAAMGLQAAAQPERERPPLDIDLDLTGPRSLHRLVDLAVSVQGSQRLAQWLTHGVPDPEQIERRQAVVRELSGQGRFRDRLLLNLRRVSKEPLDGAKLLQWLATPIPTTRLPGLLLVGSALVAANLALIILNALGMIPAYWPFTFALYLAFVFSNLGSLRPLLEDIIALDEELDKFASLLHHLESYPLPNCPRLADLCAAFRNPKDLPSTRLRQVKLVTALVGLRSNLAVWLLLNLVLPWDFICAALASSLRRRAAVLFPAWLETWYQLEALSSLANFAHLHPEYTYPQITPQANPVFSAQGLGHPLIPAERKICNDFAIDSLGEVDVITGSNMAGKSTFIKTVGINLCLAYAGGPVNASALRSLPLRLHTCIHISDSIADGFSYFYAEVKCLKRLLDELQQAHPWPVLYLIDEIFRGTNNRERLLGSQAYVQALIGARGCGLIATHDLELAGLAARSPSVRNYHFRDEVAQGKLVFDFKLRPGPSPTTNALKIMALEGLPVPHS